MEDNDFRISIEPAEEPPDVEKEENLITVMDGDGSLPVLTEGKGTKIRKNYTPLIIGAVLLCLMFFIVRNYRDIWIFFSKYTPYSAYQKKQSGMLNSGDLRADDRMVGPKIYSPDTKSYAYLDLKSEDNDMDTVHVFKAFVMADGSSEKALFNSSDYMLNNFNEAGILDWSPDSGGVLVLYEGPEEKSVIFVRKSGKPGKMEIGSDVEFTGWHNGKAYFRHAGEKGRNAEYITWDPVESVREFEKSMDEKALKTYALVEKGKEPVSVIVTPTPQASPTVSEEVEYLKDKVVVGNSDSTTPSFPAQQNEPVECLKYYYECIDGKKFRDAYRLESNPYRMKTSYDKWYKKIWDNNISIKVLRTEVVTREENKVVVDIDVYSVDKSRKTGENEGEKYFGRVRMIKDKDVWWIDKSDWVSETDRNKKAEKDVSEDNDRNLMKYIVVSGCFKELRRAQIQKDDLESRGFTARIINSRTIPGFTPGYNVCVIGYYDDYSIAEKAVSEIKDKGFEAYAKYIGD